MNLEHSLRDLFGFPGFRRGQREACEAALAGRDALVVMPTGSGKSLCYQLPALVGDDLAIVVSPLVALMQDQVEALHARGREDVALVNSQQDSGTNRAAVDAALEGKPAALVRGARALLVAGVRRPHPRREHRAVRGRRGALRIAVGARLPA